MLNFLGSYDAYDYYMSGKILKNNYATIIRFKRSKKNKRKIDDNVKELFDLSNREYKEFNKKYSGYEIIPFMYNNLFCFAFNSSMINKEIIFKYTEIYKLDHNNYIVKDYSGAYHHLIMAKGDVVYDRDLNCSNCSIIGNIIICDNKIYNYKSKTFSFRYDEISLFDVRKIDNRYVECALATIIVNCNFSDVSNSEELSFYIDTKGNAITPIETSLGTFKARTAKEINEVRNKVYNSLKKSNYARREYIKKKKM